MSISTWKKLSYADQKTGKDVGPEHGPYCRENMVSTIVSERTESHGQWVLSLEEVSTCQWDQDSVSLSNIMPQNSRPGVPSFSRCQCQLQASLEELKASQWMGSEPDIQSGWKCRLNPNYRGLLWVKLCAGIKGEANCRTYFISLRLGFPATRFSFHLQVVVRIKRENAPKANPWILIWSAHFVTFIFNFGVFTRKLLQTFLREECRGRDRNIENWLVACGSLNTLHSMLV